LDDEEFERAKGGIGGKGDNGSKNMPLGELSKRECRKRQETSRATSEGKKVQRRSTNGKEDGKAREGQKKVKQGMATGSTNDQKGTSSKTGIKQQRTENYKLPDRRKSNLEAKM